MIVVLALGLSVAAVDWPNINSSDDPPTVIAADAARGVVVLAISESAWGSDDGACELNELGGKGARLEVLHVDDEKSHREYEIASLHEPCGTKAGAQKAHIAARAEILAKDGVDIDKQPRPAVIKGKPKLTTRRSDDDGGLFTDVGRWSFAVGGVPLFGDAYDSGNGAGNTRPEEIDIWQIDKTDLFVELDSIGGMRGTQWRYVLWRANPPANGVDVTALSTLAKALPKTCQVSVVGSQPVIHDVAVTTAYALADAPLAQSKAERPTSSVFASHACMDTARTIAAKIKGGAVVEPLTWKSSRPIVVALGAGAAGSVAR
jgi:hypothetical protein